MIRFSSAFLFCAVILCGCADRQTDAPVVPPVTAPAVVSPAETKEIALRNNAVSLLYDLVGQEKNVSKVLLIKHDSADLGRLIHAISLTTGDISDRLDRMAAADPALKLHALRLPIGEKATRDAIAKTEEHELLFSTGDNFQFQLLLTQADALSYGWHLAKMAADNSKQPEEVRAFTEMSGAMKDLYQQVVGMLKATKNP
jgi:hypothetical protein